MKTRPGRKPRVLMLGLPFFGQRLATDLSTRGWTARFRHHPGHNPRAWAAVLRDLHRADVLYLISARAEKGSPLDRLLQVFPKPVVIHWVGTDVLIAAGEHARGNLSRRVVARAAHWCDTPWLVGELADIGITATYVALPVANLSKGPPAPLPDGFRALMYLPVDAFDREVFDMETILRLPSAFPAVEFVLIPSPGETLPGPLPRNLDARDWVTDMDALYASVSCYIRLTHHDGMPFTVLEALSRGRHVIFTHPMAGTRAAAGFDAVSAAIRELLAAHGAGTLVLNAEGIAAVADAFDGDRLGRNLSRRLWHVLRPPTVSPT